jgi:hypothetical protein
MVCLSNSSSRRVMDGCVEHQPFFQCSTALLLRHSGRCVVVLEWPASSHSRAIFQVVPEWPAMIYSAADFPSQTFNHLVCPASQSFDLVLALSLNLHEMEWRLSNRLAEAT